MFLNFPFLIKKNLPQGLKNFYHYSKAIMAAFYFGFPSRKITIIGVTGTNGKTTTCEMIAQTLENCKGKTALLSTIKFKIGKKETVNKTKYTTLSPFKTQKFIAQAAKENCQFVVLETSSHALDQERVWGVDFDAAVITNTTWEHLDYHKNMSRYRAAKKKLFEKLKNNLTFFGINLAVFLKFYKPKNKKLAVINLDIENPAFFLEETVADEICLYGLEKETEFGKKNKLKALEEKLVSMGFEKNQTKSTVCEILAKDLILSHNETRFKIHDTNFHLKLIGKFNIENALAALAVANWQEIPFDKAAKVLEKIEKIPGRMDEIKNKRGIKIIIDYALTPDSMEKVGEIFDEIKKQEKEKGLDSKIIWVFGSCGNRDREKRPKMGEIVAKYADFVIVTNEDPYDEDPQAIIEEIFVGVLKKDKRENLDAFKILDRQKAFIKALNLAKKGNLLIITGKGAEETMMIKGNQIPWNDRAVLEELLKEKNPD